jgi:type I restriction enzyme S subunit
LASWAICPPELREGNVSREIAVIPLRDGVDPRFAMFMLSAPTSQARMRGHVRGTSYVGINLKDVRTIEIPVPDLKLQASTVDKFLPSKRRLTL